MGYTYIQDALKTFLTKGIEMGFFNLISVLYCNFNHFLEWNYMTIVYTSTKFNAIKQT